MLAQYTQALQAEVQQRQELGTVLRSLLAAQVCQPLAARCSADHGSSLKCKPERLDV